LVERKEFELPVLFFNADTDGLAGLQQLAADATLLYYQTDEAKEGRDAFMQMRRPNFAKFSRATADAEGCQPPATHGISCGRHGVFGSAGK
jgi:hypothetical protein